MNNKYILNSSQKCKQSNKSLIQTKQEDSYDFF